MYSMTGYGKGIAEKDGMKIVVEIKSVNHRFLDVSYKLPRGFISEEDKIKKILTRSVSRGHFDIFLTYDKSAEKGISIDSDLVARYKSIAKELKPLGIKDDLTASVVLRLPDVIISTEEDDDALKDELTQKATEIAVDNLLKMREREGSALVSDLSKKIDNMEVLHRQAQEIAPTVRQKYYENLKKRVTELLDGSGLDESRILEEVAVYSDKVAVDEELVRLKGHLDHFRELLKTGNGKNLDFLTQEMGREVNTLGSKSNDLSLTDIVLTMKNEVEKIREQVQNLE